jgi:hypothetical protein
VKKECVRKERERRGKKEGGKKSEWVERERRGE